MQYGNWYSTSIQLNHKCQSIIYNKTKNGENFQSNAYQVKLTWIKLALIVKKSAQ